MKQRPTEWRSDRLELRAQQTRTQQLIFCAQWQLSQWKLFLSDSQRLQNPSIGVCYAQACLFFMEQACRSLMREVAATYRLSDPDAGVGRNQLQEMQSLLQQQGKKAPELEWWLEQLEQPGSWWPGFFQVIAVLYAPAMGGSIGREMLPVSVPDESLLRIVQEPQLMNPLIDGRFDPEKQTEWLEGMKVVVKEVRRMAQEW